MTAIGRRLFAIFIVALTFMCFVQMLTDFFDASPSFQLKNSVHANEQYILIPPAKTGDGAKKGPATQDGAAIFRKMIGSRKTNMLPPARSPRRPLKPGRKLQQEVYELSNGTAVGWLLRYDREKFPLLHASPACGKHDIYVAFVVSAGRNFDRRQAIRKTWGSQLKTVFVLGSNSTKNPELEKEAFRNKDIVQAAFQEGYYNLTYNVITGLRWVSIYCPKAEYIIKGDDDSWFNVEPLKTEIASAAYDEGPMLLGNALNFRTNRDRKSKWFTPKNVIQQDTLPKFLSGSGYVLTREALQLIYHAAISEPLVLNLEDLFLTGFIAEQHGIPRVNLKHFHRHRLPNKTVDGCTYGSALQGHEISPTEMLKLWKDIRKPNLIC